MNPETGIPRKPLRVTTKRLRNAYRLKPATEYNVGTSARQVIDLKMYAELRRITGSKPEKTQKRRIKNLRDNKPLITRDFFMKKLYDNVFNSNPLLQRLKDKSYRKVSGGNKILIPLEYDDVSASGWYSGSETLSITDNEVFTAAAVDWCQLYASVNISGRDKRINNGSEQVIDFVASKIKNAEKTMAALLSTGIYSDGTDSKSIVGLRDWVATDQTVGGISQTTYTWWAGQVDSSTTTLTLSTMQTLYHNCVLNNMQPSVAVGTKANYNRYYALLQPQQRFVDTTSAKGGQMSGRLAA